MVAFLLLGCEHQGEDFGSVEGVAWTVYPTRHPACKQPEAKAGKERGRVNSGSVWLERLRRPPLVNISVCSKSLRMKALAARCGIGICAAKNCLDIWH
jgi:hypothetical protein